MQKGWKHRFTLINFMRFLYIFGAFVAVLLLFPHGGKFGYEFRNGKPWMHDDLYAPFDFPVYKTETELVQERNNILKNAKHFYRLDSTISVASVGKFRSDFRNIWDGYINQSVNVQYISTKHKEAVKKTIISRAVDILNEIYAKGIFEKSNLEIERESNSEFSLVVGNKIYDYNYTDVYTKVSAIDYLKRKVEKLDISVKDTVFLNVFKYVDFQPYIKPNLFFDDGLTQKYKTELLSNISLTHGLVQAGERIVSQGEVISPDVFQELESLKREYENKLGSRKTFAIMFGNAILVFSLFVLLVLFLLNFRPEVLKETSKLLFILMMILLMVFITSYVVRKDVFNIYIIPLVIVPIFIKTFFDSRLALFVHMLIIFMIGFLVPNSFEFVFINFAAGVVAIISLTNFYRRGRLFLTVSLVYVTYVLLHLGLVTVEEGTPLAEKGTTFLWFAINALLLLASYQLVYLFEKLFGFLSDATLIELSDTNLDLLRKLAEVAPGTFQHSLQVANLAESAVMQVGGNTLLVRAGALYHDIGKMANPFYFVENQVNDYNPHRNLDYAESAKIIINHVTEGVKIAKKAGLPQQIIDFIQTHHGTSKVRYFFQKQRDKYSDEEVDAKQFTYPGPKPMSKETAIVMMSDTIEAASRSLKDITAAKIDELVETLITRQQSEGQFENADVTFKELTDIKSIFKRKLENIYHARIEYPKESN